MRSLLVTLLVLLSAQQAYSECDGVAGAATAAAQSAYPQLQGRALDECSSSRYVPTNLRGALLRFRPHESRERTRLHWQVSCRESQEGEWVCDEPGITRTILVREPDDWAEILGEVGDDRAIKVAAFARSEAAAGVQFRGKNGDVFIPGAQLTDVNHVLSGGGEYIVGFRIPGEDPCLQIVPREESLELFLVQSCGSE